MTISLFHPDWLDWEPVRDVLTVLEAAGAEVRLYGGAVREALLGGGLPKDFDLIISMPMEQVAQALLYEIDFPTVQSSVMKQKKIKGVYKAQLFDITQSVGDPQKPKDFGLRVQEMMRTCDLTINALSLSPIGILYDDFGGLRDGLSGNIRFVENPITAIKNRPIHILRFFCFFAWYGKTAPDAETLAAFEDLGYLLPQEPQILLRKFILQMLEAPSVRATIALMKDCGVLEQLFGFAIDTGGLAGLEQVEALLREPPAPLLRLAALLLGASVSPGLALGHITQAWDLPEDVYKPLRTLVGLVQHVNPAMNGAVKKNLRLQAGEKGYRQLVLLRWAAEQDVECAKEAYATLLD